MYILKHLFNDWSFFFLLFLIFPHQGPPHPIPLVVSNELYHSYTFWCVSDRHRPSGAHKNILEHIDK